MSHVINPDRGARTVAASIMSSKLEDVWPVLAKLVTLVGTVCIAGGWVASALTVGTDEWGTLTGVSSLIVMVALVLFGVVTISSDDVIVEAHGGLRPYANTLHRIGFIPYERHVLPHNRRIEGIAEELRGLEATVKRMPSELGSSTLLTARRLGWLAAVRHDELRSLKSLMLDRDIDPADAEIISEKVDDITSIADELDDRFTALLDAASTAVDDSRPFTDPISPTAGELLAVSDADEIVAELGYRSAAWDALHPERIIARAPSTPAQLH